MANCYEAFNVNGPRIFLPRLTVLEMCTVCGFVQALDSIDGDLTQEEHDILLPLVPAEDCQTAEFWDQVASKSIPWRCVL